jgi:hypothetical protein
LASPLTPGVRAWTTVSAPGGRYGVAALVSGAFFIAVNQRSCNAARLSPAQGCDRLHAAQKVAVGRCRGIAPVRSCLRRPRVLRRGPPAQ